MYQHIEVPVQGRRITINADNSLNVPDQLILPYIEGDTLIPLRAGATLAWKLLAEQSR